MIKAIHNKGYYLELDNKSFKISYEITKNLVKLGVNIVYVANDNK